MNKQWRDKNLNSRLCVHAKPSNNKTKFQKTRAPPATQLHTSHVSLAFPTTCAYVTIFIGEKRFSALLEQRIPAAQRNKFSG
jgi:hypothetical protein